MKISKNQLAVAAAFAGLTSGLTVSAAQPHHAGVIAGTAFGKKKAMEKHACKGMNSCKGNGGGDKKEWGKNSCKGKGSCATDGSKPKM